MTVLSLRTTGAGGKVLHVAVFSSKVCTKRDDSQSGQTPPETYRVLPILVTVPLCVGTGRLGSLSKYGVEQSSKSCSLLKICSGRGFNYHQGNYIIIRKTYAHTTRFPFICAIH